MNPDLSLARNGHSPSGSQQSRSDRAKWLLTESKRIPHIGFGVPPEEMDPRALMGVPEGEERKEAVREYIEAQLLARYGTNVEKLRGRLEGAEMNLTRTRADFDRLNREREKMSPLEASVRQSFEMPGGIMTLITAALVTLGCGLAISEWLNAAGFAARHEMQSLPLAMSFTFVFMLIPVALKCAGFRLRIAITVVGIFFLTLYAKCYVSSPDATAANALVNELLNSGTAGSGSFSFDFKPLLLIFQVTLSCLVSLAFGSIIAKLAISETHYKINPDLEILDRELARLQSLIDGALLIRGEVAGDLKEFENSLAVHATHLLGVVNKFAELQKAKSNLLATLNRQVADLETEVSNKLLLNNNH